MIYQFKSEDGSVIERHYPMSRAPEIGKPIRVGGKRYVRILSLPAAIGLATCDSDEFPKVCHTAPPRSGKHYVTDRRSRHFGKTLFMNKHERDDYCREHGYVRDQPTDRDLESPPKTPSIPETVAKELTRQSPKERRERIERAERVIHKHKVKTK